MCCQKTNEETESLLVGLLYVAFHETAAGDGKTKATEPETLTGCQGAIDLRIMIGTDKCVCAFVKGGTLSSPQKSTPLKKHAHVALVWT